jgi:hypothetical protein
MVGRESVEDADTEGAGPTTADQAYEPGGGERGKRKRGNVVKVVRDRPLVGDVAESVRHHQMQIVGEREVVVMLAPRGPQVRVEFVPAALNYALEQCAAGQGVSDVHQRNAQAVLEQTDRPPARSTRS